MTPHAGLKFLRNVDILQDNTASKFGRLLIVYFQTRNRQNLHNPLFQTTQEKWHAVQNRSAMTLLCGYGDLQAVDENFIDKIHLTSLLEHRRSYEKRMNITLCRPRNAFVGQQKS
jgi:hypothetical protein